MPGVKHAVAVAGVFLFPPPEAASRGLFVLIRSEGGPYWVSRVWVGLSRLGALPLLRRRRSAAVKELKEYKYLIG